MDQRSPLAVQRSVLFALLIRELKTRFGRYRLGYVWALLEPAAHVLVLTTIFGIFRSRTVDGIDYPVFFAAGIVPWFMFSNMVSRGMTAVSANQGLFGYRQVKAADALIARMLLEGLIHLAVLGTLLLIAFWIGYRVEVHDPLGLLAALLLLYGFGFGCALMACVTATLYEETQKFIPMLMRPLYFVSGIFFSLSTIPSEYRIYLLWNPILHALELVRKTMFPSFDIAGASWQYLAIAAVSTLCLGLALYRRSALRLVTP
jgi:capsular polysaccharide transport system permease protein